MAHGTPDWGLVGPKTTTYGMDDEGEAAVRLGSPHFFDRRGDVLSLTDFGEGLGSWEPELSGLNAAVTLETEHSRTGPYAVGLQAGDDGSQYARLVQAIAYPVRSAIGLEFTFNVHEDTWYWAGGLSWFDAVGDHLAVIYYDHTLPALRYYSAGGIITDFYDPGTLRELAHASHTLKMVVDMTPDPLTGTGQYVRVILDDVAYPLTGIGIWLGPATSVLHLLATVEHHGPGTIHPKAYVDNIIVTQNEPLYQG